MMSLSCSVARVLGPFGTEDVHECAFAFHAKGEDMLGLPWHSSAKGFL